MSAAPSTAAGHAALVLPGLPESVRVSRELARAAAGDDGQAEAAALCVSELVTNALVHSRSGLPGGTVTVHIEELPGTRALRIAVHDDGALALAPARAETGLPGAAECGYGLGIVAAIATEWGTGQDADGRPVTWCVIASAGTRT
jgi:anti-sigma regulatory factor (Ser/Thr protein kinase)